MWQLMVAATRESFVYHMAEELVQQLVPLMPTTAGMASPSVTLGANDVGISVGGLEVVTNSIFSFSSSLDGFAKCSIAA